MFRIDTCEEVVGESGTPIKHGYQTGPGVTIELVQKIRQLMIDHGFARYTENFLSSGFGNEQKAAAFVKANEDFKKKTGYNLFKGVGIGEVHEGIFCTADVCEVTIRH